MKASVKIGRKDFRWAGSYYAFEVAWRLLYMIALPFVSVGRAYLWLKGRPNAGR